MPPGYRIVHRLAPIRPAIDGDRVFWIIDGPDGRFTAGTRHNHACIPSDEEIGLLIGRHEVALADLRMAKGLLGRAPDGRVVSHGGNPVAETMNPGRPTSVSGPGIPRNGG